MIKDNLSQVKSIPNSTFVSAKTVLPTEKELIYEHFLAPEIFQQALNGEGFIWEDQGEFLATINIHNHIQFQMLDCKQELEKAWTKLTRIETEFGKFLNYAFSAKFGFLTAHPHNCGTGLSIRIFLQIPALLHSTNNESFLETHKDPNINYSGIQGDPKELIGDILVLENNYSLGLSEEDIIRQLHNKATQIIVEEKGLRNTLQNDPNTLMRDKVSRAFGLLKHSIQLETPEALEALSLCKLGIALEWMSGISINEINQIFLNCRRGHLIKLCKKDIPFEEIPQYRAEYIQNALGSTQLTASISKI